MAEVSDAITQHPLAVCLRILQTMGAPGKAIWDLGKWYGGEKPGAGWMKNKAPLTTDERVSYLKQAIDFYRQKVGEKVEWREIPVDFRTFVESPAYMNKAGTLWPEVIRCAADINSGRYTECVLTGGIGVAKTTIALYTQAYQTYIMSCMESPHDVFDLDRASEIVIVFQSVNKSTAKDVDYMRLRNMITDSPYFNRAFMFQQDRESDMRFPRNIWIKPVAGHDQAAIGQNVIGGILDEVNFMAVVEKSKQASDGGTYNQALQNYESIARRRESRFMKQGMLPGMLCLVSSRKYPGQFTDIKEEEAKKNPRIYVYDKRIWELRPENYSGEKFKIFIGDIGRRPRILLDNEKVLPTEEPLVREIPIEYRHQFEANLINAIRDIAGLATQALNPFIVNTDAITEAFGTVPSLLSRTECDFHTTKPMLYRNRIMNPTQPRFVHIDLAMRRDSCGFAVGHVPCFIPISRGEMIELLPVFQYDLTLAIKPPKGGEIQFSQVRQLIYDLKENGLPIKWVTSDNEQMSKDTLQILGRKGYQVGYFSLDTATEGYDVLKQALYDRRVRAPQHELARVELTRLEIDPSTNKIDHQPNGCFTGDTRVALVDGTLPTFKELAERFAPDEEFYVYSIGKDGLCTVPARNSRITKVADTLVEVTLDNHQVVRCTPEHLFMTLDGEWVEAQHLTVDVSIMPLYRSQCARGGWLDYEFVWDPVNRTRHLTHHLAYGSSPSKGFHLHHKDDNKRNNDPRNLEMLTHAEHCRIHGLERWAKREARMREGHAAYREDSAAQALHAETVRKMWADGKFGARRAGCSVVGCDRSSNARGLCDMHYQRSKRAGLLPYRTATQHNHRILGLCVIPANEPVYDITVPGTENFALASGVFVHNSKDVADAMAGVARGLLTRRDVWVKHGVSLRDRPVPMAKAPVNQISDGEIRIQLAEG